MHSTAPTRRSTVRRERLALSPRQRHAQRHHRHKSELDSKHTKKASRNLFSVELDRSERTRPQVVQLRRSDAHPSDQNPPAGLQPGQELWETGLTVVAPPAVPSRTTSSGRPHRTWLNFTRRYVHANFETHIIGNSNLRYRNQSFAEHCHHATVDWDNHPFCPHCYMAFGLVECAKAPPGVQSTCRFCEMNSYATDVERRKVFRRRRDIARSKHRDLPKNCYTQADCDTYAYENNYCEVPNPAWLEPNAPIEGCVPSSLIPFKIRAEQRRAFVDQQEDWREFDAYADMCIMHNRDNAARCMVRTTPSQENRPTVPIGLAWAPGDVTPPLDFTGTPQRQQAPQPSSSAVAPNQDSLMLDDLEEMGLPPVDEISGISPNELDSIVNALASDDVRDTHALVTRARSASRVTAAPTATVTAPPQHAAAADRSRTPPTTSASLHLPVTPAAPAHSAPAPPVSVSVTDSSGHCARSRPRLTCSVHIQTDVSADAGDLRPASTTIDRALERHAMEVAAWSAPQTRALPDPFPQWNPTLDSTPQVELLQRYGLPARTTRRQFSQQAGTSETIQLDTDDVMYIAMDEAFALAARTPYNMTVELPSALTSQNSDALYFQACGTISVPDAEGHYPTATDTLVLTQHESRQLVVLANMNSAVTNTESQALTNLMQKLATGTPLHEITCELNHTLQMLLDLQRQRRVLASSLQALATLIPRRDLMLRCNLPPHLHSNIFMHAESDPSQLPLPTANVLTGDSPRVQQPSAELQEAVRRRHRAFVYENATGLSDAAQRERQRFLRLDAAERRAAAATAQPPATHAPATTADTSIAATVSSGILLRTTAPAVTTCAGRPASVSAPSVAATAKPRGHRADLTVVTTATAAPRVAATASVTKQKKLVLKPITSGVTPTSASSVTPTSASSATPTSVSSATPTSTPSAAPTTHRPPSPPTLTVSAPQLTEEQVVREMKSCRVATSASSTCHFVKRGYEMLLQIYAALKPGQDTSEVVRQAAALLQSASMLYDQTRQEHIRIIVRILHLAIPRAATEEPYMKLVRHWTKIGLYPVLRVADSTPSPYDYREATTVATTAATVSATSASSSTSTVSPGSDPQPPAAPTPTRTKQSLREGLAAAKLKSPSEATKRKRTQDATSASPARKAVPPTTTATQAARAPFTPPRSASSDTQSPASATARRRRYPAALTTRGTPCRPNTPPPPSSSSSSDSETEDDGDETEVVIELE